MDRDPLSIESENSNHISEGIKIQVCENYEKGVGRHGSERHDKACYGQRFMTKALFHEDDHSFEEDLWSWI